MIDYHRLMDWQLAEALHSYSADDSMRYALALGLGRDPLDAAQLRFCDDTAPARLQALPTMAVVLGFPGSWMSDPATGIDFSQIVHGEEQVEWHAVLPPARTLRSFRMRAPERGRTVLDHGHARIER